MQISNINNSYQTYKPSFGSVKKIKFTEQFNPSYNPQHLAILDTFKNSEAIKNCCQDNDVTVTFNYVDTDVYEQIAKATRQYNQKPNDRYKGQHIHSTFICIKDVNDSDKSYITIFENSDNETETNKKIIKQIKNLRPDFYKQDEFNKFMTLKYQTQNILETIKSW